ncbi:MAG: glycosyltransferase family 4 protein [Chloroflexi bacterium]|nr:glycosyltransferase family 4 protein [Chloroflexota bacterium]
MTAAQTVANRLAFIRVFPKAPVGDSVAHMLRTAFPEFEVDVLDVTALLKRRPDVMIMNGLALLRDYGRDILRGHRTVGEAFWGTSYLFTQTKRLIQQTLARRPGSYAFTFQLQSMIDAHTGGLPHFVYTDHTHLANLSYGRFNTHRLNSTAWLAQERRLYQEANLVFTRSSNISHSLIEQYGLPAEKVVCVYAGVNVPPQPVGDNGRYHQQHILFVGADWERKGGPDLVQAFQQVQKRLPQARLTIVGAAPELDAPNCRVLGQVPVADVSRYYQEASVFCLPTQLEPFGVAFIEAMAHRLPIVATAVGAIPDFVKEGYNGRLVAPNSVPELTAALHTLLDNPQMCETYGANGYQLFQDRYNWDRVGETIRQHVLASLPSSPSARK